MAIIECEPTGGLYKLGWKGQEIRVLTKDNLKTIMMAIRENLKYME